MASSPRWRGLDALPSSKVSRGVTSHPRREHDHLEFYIALECRALNGGSTVLESVPRNLQHQKGTPEQDTRSLHVNFTACQITSEPGLRSLGWVRRGLSVLRLREFIPHCVPQACIYLFASLALSVTILVHRVCLTA